jgi:hypothetical protein
MKPCFRRGIPFLPLFCHCRLNSIPLLPSSYPGRLTSRNLTHYSQLNQSARTTQKIQTLFYYEGVFTVPLHSNGSYLIVVCLLVAVEMCLPCRCLALNVYSDFIIPTFRRHVKILMYLSMFPCFQNITL